MDRNSHESGRRNSANQPRPAANLSDSVPRLCAFVGLTFLISWPIWYASGVLSPRDQYFLDAGWLVAQIGVLAPTLAAVILSSTGGPGMRKNGFRILGIQLLPLLLPGMIVASRAPAGIGELGPLSAVVTVVVAGVAIVFFSPLNRSLLLPGTGEKPGRPGTGSLLLSILLFPSLFLVSWWLANFGAGTLEVTAIQGGGAGFAGTLAVGFSFNLVLGGSLGEEVGWRGFFLPCLLKRLGPLGASIVLGLVWALWHMPIDLTAGFALKGPLAVVARIIWTIPITVIFTWLYVRSNGSLLVALMLHTSINVLSALGFANFEGALAILTLLNLVLAGAIALSGSFTIRRGSSS